MVRKPRIHYNGACYHVILRGNAHQDIFFGDEDRLVEEHQAIIESAKVQA
jgi:REP element-mobilizing transposase RayT